MDDDLEFSSSQLLLLENEFQKANLAKPNPGDTMTNKDRRTPSFVLPPSVQPPSIDWCIANTSTKNGLDTRPEP
uniref:Uncharacterized protein n=1 Tax=Timema cristinae TaxID=61476 RepID=A0A7R9GR70_TIMCR|nr:unnamed protein product [Timema cristinae]